MTAIPPDDPVEWGARGLALVERYADREEQSDLELAIDALQRALDGGSQHPDSAVWRYWLALGLLTRADATADLPRAMADYGRGVAGGEALYAGLDADDPDRDVVAILLVDGYWDRSWRLRYAQRTGHDEAAADADRLLRELDRVGSTGHDEVVTAYLMLMRGLASLERYGYEPNPHTRARLDTGIAVVRDALARLVAVPAAAGAAEQPATWAGRPRLALAYGLLADAYQRRGLLDERAEDFDLSIEAAQTALDWHGPDAAPSGLLHTYLAEAHQLRWLAYCEAAGEGALPDGAADHLDAAIDAWRAALAHDRDSWCARNLGDLLRERAERVESRQDAADAVAVLRPAAGRAAGDGDEEWWKLWRLLADAGHVLWRLTGAQDCLVTATADLDRALAHPALPHDDLLQMRVNRMEWERQLASAGLVRTVSGAPGARTVFRTEVENGRRDMQLAVGADPDLRAAFAGMLALGEFSAAAHDTVGYDVQRVRDLLAVAATARGMGPRWASMLRYAAGIIGHVEDLRHPTAGSDGGVGDLVHGLDVGEPGGDFDERLMMLAAARVTRMGVTGDRRQPFVPRAGRGRDGREHPAAGPRPEGDATDAAVMAAYVELLADVQDDPAGLAATLQRVGPMLEALPRSAESYPIARLIDVLGGIADPVGTPAVTLPPIRPIRSLLDLPELAHNVACAMVLAVQGVTRGDLTLVRQAAEHAEALVEVVPAADARLRLAATGVAGFARLEMARRTADGGPDAIGAAAHLQRAIEIAGGHAAPVWATLTVAAAEALRRLPDPDRRRSRELGLAAMRGHAWQVFAQAGTGHAIVAARAAAATARTVASWCLADRDGCRDVDEQLIAVLDAGRGLVLQATTTSRQVADRLAERGHHDLATEWRATDGRGRQLVTDALTSGLAGAPTPALDIPDELRLKVLHALGTEEVVGFEPVSSAEIRNALRAVDADALVYLLPGDDGASGAAVVVPASADPVVRLLPRLHVGSGSPVPGYARTNVRGRDLKPVAGPQRDGLLGDVCEWAWSAAIGELLGIAGTWRLSRPVRLVLVPMGMLGLVPWHAARTSTSTGAGHRYAVAEAVFSYTPSARMLCATAAHRTAPVRSALVVGDPGGDLRFAGLEARAVHRVFYPEGSYFGRPAREAQRSGTPDDVLEWIASSPPGPSLLHFACHGAIDPQRPAEAHLVLAGGAALSAGLMLERSRSAAMEIEQVFLAACTTSVTGHDHDEVLSLATSFLAAGARTVFGSLWPVPDEDTSVLMFMLHYFLRTAGCSPVDALHRAQLWMLDPARRLPDRMPAELRAYCGPGTVFAPLSWAGFTHLGR